MSVQNRPWHFGSDGSSPIDRVRRVGYDGRLVGETISETYETELETLAAWMDEENTRRLILAPEAAAWASPGNRTQWQDLVDSSWAAARRTPKRRRDHGGGS